MVRYKVTLTQEERLELESILKKGNHSSLEFCNACILLNSDESAGVSKLAYKTLSQVLHVSVKKIERLKRRFVEEGYGACLGRKPYPAVKGIKIDGDFEAHLIALSCSESPEGYARWSLRLLAEKMVELNYIDSVSHETVRKTLKKTKLNHGEFRAG